MLIADRLSESEWSARVGALLGDETQYPEVEGAFPSSTSAWPIPRELGRVLARLVVQLDRRNVLEFGAGASSMVFAQSLTRLGGGRLTSVEEDPRWTSAQWAFVSNMLGVDAHLVSSRVAFRLRREGMYHGYTAEAEAVIARRAPYSLVLIDAPDGYIGRDGALHLAFPYLAPGALIVVDDARRRKERDTIARWRATYPGLLLLADDPALGHGTAILGYTGDATRLVSPRAMLSSAIREAYASVRTLFDPLPTPPGTQVVDGVQLGHDDQHSPAYPALRRSRDN